MESVAPDWKKRLQARQAEASPRGQGLGNIIPREDDRKARAAKRRKEGSR